MPDNNRAFIPGGEFDFINAPSTPLGFGGIERRVDVRDFELGSYQPPATIPQVYKPDVSDIPVYMQGMYPTCGAHAGAFKATLMRKYKTAVTTSLSPKYLWDEIKQIDGFPLQDGTDMTSIFKSIAKTGDCQISLLPNDLRFSLESYSSISNVTPEMVQDASLNLIKNYAFTNNPTMEQIKESIYLNKAVVALVDIGDGWWLPDYAHVLPLRLGNKVGHHFIVLWGYDMNYIYFRNSWSQAWGNKGDGYFDQSYVPHILEIGAAIFLSNQFIFTKDLQYGDAGNDVLNLQRRLNIIPDTGFFGKITKAAVIKYQLANGLPGTGYCGVLTRTKLNLS